MLPVQTFVVLFSNLAIGGRDKGVSTTSRVDCARLCFQQHHHCSSFFYNHNTSSCSTSRRTLRSRHLSHSEGVTYYAIRTNIKSPRRNRDSKKECQRHWSRFGNSCFKIVKEKKTWAQAQESCQKMGGNLAKVDSKVALRRMRTLIVFSFSTSKFWIGGHKASFNESWTWADNSSVLQPMWNPGEPSHKYGCCMNQKMEGWNDDSCSQKIHFACENKI